MEEEGRGKGIVDASEGEYCLVRAVLLGWEYLGNGLLPSAVQARQGVPVGKSTACVTAGGKPVKTQTNKLPSKSGFWL